MWPAKGTRSGRSALVPWSGGARATGWKGLAPKRMLCRPTETTMSVSRLPPELLDHVADHLDTADTLRNCCLVSKSWVPSTRRHLFADIRFDTAETLRLWTETFPDPSTSPAKYTKTLIIDCIQAVTVADAEPGGWIRGFSCVLCMRLSGESRYADGSMISLLPFHGLSPVLKSLRVNFSSLPSSLVFDLILSFPLLEDLKVITRGEPINNHNGSPRPSTTPQPSNQPMTGCLDLSQWGGMGFIASRLLSLPGGIHFWKLVLRWSKAEDISLTMGLVEGCSHTLEYLEIACGFLGSSLGIRFRTGNLFLISVGWGPNSIDLSKATRLKNSVFRVESQRVDWITMALHTIVPEHRDLQQITICLPYDPNLSGAGADVGRIAGDLILGQWLELDHLLAQLWESRSMRPKILYFAPRGMEKDVTDCVRCLLPGITEGGIIDLTEWTL